MENNKCYCSFQTLQGSSVVSPTVVAVNPGCALALPRAFKCTGACLPTLREVLMESGPVWGWVPVF